MGIVHGWRLVRGRHDHGRAEQVPAAPPPEPWVVDRPAEVSQVITALGDSDGGTVGITTAVQGAGGFGKTTVARMVSGDPRVLRRYRGQVYWVTLGRYARRETLTGLVNGLIAELGPDRAVTFTDTRQAADQLAAILAAGPRRLLILDDVWTGQQLTAFPPAGQCARLVTTRIPALTAAGTATPVRVDQMTDGQARAVLLHGLPPLPPAVVEGLLAETGGWPLLLRLVNKILAMLRTDITVAAEELLGRLRAGRELQVDEVTGTAGRRLDVADQDQRNEAVRATIQASAGLLSRAEQNLLAALAVFAGDGAIPVGLIALLWQAISGLDHLAAGALVTRLGDLAMLTPAPGGTVTMHDVVRDYFRGRLGAARLAQLHAILLDAVADGLPCVLAAGGGAGVSAWWELPEHARYLRSHLLEHMLAADRPDMEAVATDLRWAASRLGQGGPAAVCADLTLAGTPRAYRLRRLLGQNAHLLAPTDPPHSLASILYSRVSHDPDWALQAASLAASPGRPALANAWPLPDLPPSALRLILTGHDGPVRAAAAAPDGSWLATASDDGTARIWDATTGQHRTTLTGHDAPVHAVAAAAESSWLATGGDDGTARIWDATTGQQRTTLTGHDGPVHAVAAAPDGHWLATASDDGTARIWDATTGQQRATLTGHDGRVCAVAAAPDGG
jgi:NB-ARC domain/WD domain, G-beta repeat